MKPSITGGLDRSKAAAKGGTVLAAEACCSTGVDAAAITDHLTQHEIQHEKRTCPSVLRMRDNIRACVKIFAHALWALA